MKEGREEVVSMLLGIPDIILEADHKLENFGDDLALSDKIEELNVAILKVLQCAVESMRKNPFRELLIPIMSPSC
jgi:hypothetical protein